MILKGSETPYYKNRMPDASAGTLITSDTLVNKDIAHLITDGAVLQTKMQIIENICRTDSVDAEAALVLINTILGGEW